MHNSIPYARPLEEDGLGPSLKSPGEFIRNIPSLVAHLTRILQDRELYRKLVGCQLSDAQRLLDSFQQLLDSSDLDQRFRKSLSVATQRISAKSGFYPACYELKDVAQQGEYPVNAGGFADIYKGMFQGQVVCLKTFRLYQTDQIEHMLKIDDLSKATSKEAILWRQLLHPNVLTLFGLYRFQNRISLVTLWMENGDINVYLKKNPAVDVGNGLTYLHENGIIHGDLKGPNILVDDVGRACLADFGISSISDSQIVVWTTQSSGTVKGGSTRWQAPELFAIGDSDMADEEVEAAVKNTMASDVYALGCIFFEIFTGEVPFASITRDNTVILRVLSGARPARPPSSSPSKTEWGLTQDIWACIGDCWKGQPSERPPATGVVRRLAAGITTADTRQGPNTDLLLPNEFRRRMSESLEIITVEDLTRILDIHLELTDQDVKDIVASNVPSSTDASLLAQHGVIHTERQQQTILPPTNDHAPENLPTQPTSRRSPPQATSSFWRSVSGGSTVRSETGNVAGKTNPSDTHGKKNSRWGLGMFGRGKVHLPPMLLPPSSSPPSSTRTQSSSTDKRLSQEPSTEREHTDSDPKKIKKEAERLQREAEKQRRKLAEKYHREQARAVMQKRQQAMERTTSNELDWLGGNVTSLKVLGENKTTSPHARQNQISLVSAAEARFVPQGAAGEQDWQGVDRRFSKKQRREFDDDHSIGSLDIKSPNRISSSIVSFATVDSDPGPSRSRNRRTMFSPGINRRSSNSSSLASFDDFTPAAQSSNFFSLEEQLAHDFHAQASINPKSPFSMQLLSLSPNLSPSPLSTQVPQTQHLMLAGLFINP
ncbi:hypothetical protein DXG01_002185, partial [Tephrocybe rancida]